MADTNYNPLDAEFPDAPETGRRSLLARLAIPLFIAGVILVECAVAYLCIPSASETAAMAGVRSSSEPKKR